MFVVLSGPDGIHSFCILIGQSIFPRTEDTKGWSGRPAHAYMVYPQNPIYICTLNIHIHTIGRFTISSPRVH
ncbi:hypothetical protein M404DRAFT_245197 [Pisolithus tinctorius Marx 270]|uniref:Uncharacterized protein n=1 Tax=Pisolithus tinctorius Marx 270 TaxID=870435 RepID=A0A0C3N5X1_PISTI|nr:hypothetical protein M404DRAFT_245197 [Pisolithus tinctorius Marx 270]